MKKLMKFFHIKGRQDRAAKNRKELEQKAIQGAEKAVKEYRRVFERLAEYDRA